MQALFDKIPIDNCWSSRHTCDKQSDRRSCHTRDQSCVARRRVSGLALITDDIAEMLKMRHIFAYDGLLWGWGLPRRNLHF